MKSFFTRSALAAALTLTAFSFASAQTDGNEKLAKAAPVAKAVAASTPKLRPLSVAVDLLSDTRIEGTLTDTTTLEMRTSFGSASIPLSEVAGIKFASADDASTTLVMLNGDSITGATDVKLVTVETEWGVATINGGNISSIMFVPGLNWNPASGLNGKRWNLVNVKAAAPAPAPAPAQATTQSRQPVSQQRSTISQPYSNGIPQQIYRSR